MTRIITEVGKSYRFRGTPRTHRPGFYTVYLQSITHISLVGSSVGDVRGDMFRNPSGQTKNPETWERLL
jgi:hypothetical protein